MSDNATFSPQELARAGEEAYRNEDYAAAAERFAAAEAAYRAQGDLLMAAEMANNRSVALLQAGDAQGAYEAVAPTVEFFAQRGDRRRQALALGNRAAALEALGRLKDAEKDYLASEAILHALDDTELLAAVRQQLAALHLRMRRPADALIDTSIALQGRPLTLREKILRFLLRIVYRLLGRPL